MSIDADRLAKQVRLGYEFMETLHLQAIGLIKDAETQLAEAPQELRCLKPGGYRFTVNPMSGSLERPQANIADYYAVYFRHFPDRIQNTPITQDVPPVAFLKVTLRERRLDHPEVRFGVVTAVTKPPDHEGKWPKKFEDIITSITRRVLVGPAWAGRGQVRQDYRESYFGLEVNGLGVMLADLPDSEAIAKKVVDPLLMMFENAAARD